MRKKSETQIFLEQVRRFDTMIQNKLIEKQQWMEMATSITANTDGERVQSSGAKSKMADAVIKCVDKTLWLEVIALRVKLSLTVKFAGK